MKAVDRQMAAGLERGVFPGGVLLVAEGPDILFHRAYGLANIFSGDPLTPETVFDLASLTKPLATAAALMTLAATGAAALDRPLRSLLPEFRHTDKQGVTVGQLLTHSSGYPAYRPFYRVLNRMAPEERLPALRRMLVAQPLSGTPGQRVVYSDLGYMVLAWGIERMVAQPLDRYLETSVYAPLSVDGLFFPGAGEPWRHGPVAATEDCPWRNVLLSGRVHDDNADAAGGVGGHAGLFGTARGVHQLMSHLLSVYHGDAPDGLFRRELVRLFLSPWKGTGRTPGFDRPGGAVSSAGKYFSENTVGHLGFTGTSFWMDLDRRLLVVLLTNRVHPSRNNLKIRGFRPALHDTVMEAMRRRA